MTQIIKCFIASPSDTSSEREICDKVFQNINKTIGDYLDFRIESLKWEKDVRPGFSTDGQAVINEQIGENFQMFIGIMHKKFGTPTNHADSGTEEEFNNAYERFKTRKDIEIMFYFNDEAPSSLSGIDLLQLDKVLKFKRKIAELGGFYYQYKGHEEFETALRNHLNLYFFKIFGSKKKAEIDEINNTKKAISIILQQRFNDSLRGFSNQPIIWIDPILSSTNEISRNADDNYNNRVELTSIITEPTSILIKAPQQFGLTSLSHYLIKEAWNNDSFWVYIDAQKCQSHSIDKNVRREAESLSIDISQIKCIILDAWNDHEIDSFKKLKNLCDNYNEIPIIVMQTIDDSKFLTETNKYKIDRSFTILHLLALTRANIRKVVSEYNKAKEIGEENIILSKVISDLETLNIHRTPYNCLTLLRVAEKHFDESPLNRTKMLEMVLFILFDMDELPNYKTKPDLKDCEYILGRYCEKLIRNNIYEFSRENFIDELREFCKEKLIDLELDIVFDILNQNNIIVRRDFGFVFRSSYWVYYFAAKRMHSNQEFADYILSSKRYISFPEIIEFYTGADRQGATQIVAAYS
ncbi:STAND family AAA ATPase [Hymenobacter elongatus]|uniref:STAND NTPase 4 small alpha/beta domain-containing protein n=1 Tax=Hymenobacter elongatus TaxID=877208 RepID=A0A4Z0PGQ0_9BACT|nr:hypothetical protein [Hymenobacter elongatus]TGE12251.1 hypothetical protein E5J99_20400 [Hymenobacter elongatus]